MDIGDVSRIIRDGVNGFLVLTCVSKTLDEKLVKMEKDPEL